MCCQKEAKTQLHHWVYVYKPKEVKENPELVLENVVELCYYCHRIANALKFVLEEDFRASILLETIPLNKIKVRER